MTLNVSSVFNLEDSEIEVFLELVNKQENMRKGKIESVNKNVIKKLKEIKEKIKKKADSPPKIYKFKVERYSSCLLKWVSKKLSRLQEKYDKCFKEHCLPYYEKIDAMIEHVKKFTEKELICKVDVSKLEEYIFGGLLRNNITANKYYKKVVLLDEYADFNSTSKKYPVIGESACKELLKLRAQDIDTNYFPIEEFDDVFEYFCRNNRSLDQAFDEHANKLVSRLKSTFIGHHSTESGSEVVFTKEEDTCNYRFAENDNKIAGETWNIPSVSFDFFDKLLSKVKSLVAPDGSNQDILVRNTVIRHFFDRVYEKRPYLSIPVKLTELYHKASKIKDMTVENILAGCELERDITAKYKEKKFCDIVKMNEDFGRVIKYLEESQFYISPLDINYYVNEALKIINEILRKWLKGYREKAVVESDKLIITLTAFLSMRPICDPFALLCFQQFTSKLKMANDFEVARTIYMSSVSYLRDCELQKCRKSA